MNLIVLESALKISVFFIFAVRYKRMCYDTSVENLAHLQGDIKNTLTRDLINTIYYLVH